MKIFLLIIISSGIFGCSENIPFPSGQLQGNLTHTLHDWTEVAEARVVELETNPSDPYSVKLWVIGFNERVYVHARANLARWVENILANPDVRLLIGERLFELVVAIVTDQSELDDFAQHYESKYSAKPRNENVKEAYLIILKSRP